MIYCPWRPIRGFVTAGGFQVPDNYEISFKGRIRRSVSCNSAPAGYLLRIRVQQRGNRKSFSVQLGRGHNNSRTISIAVLMARYWPEIDFRPTIKWMQKVNLMAEKSNQNLMQTPTVHRTRCAGEDTHKKNRQKRKEPLNALAFDPWAGGRTMFSETRQPDFGAGF